MASNHWALRPTANFESAWGANPGMLRNDFNRAASTLSNPVGKRHDGLIAQRLFAAREREERIVNNSKANTGPLNGD